MFCPIIIPILSSITQLFNILTIFTLHFDVSIHPPQLLDYSPVLVALPSLLVLFIVHFIIQSQKEAAKLTLAKTNPLPSTKMTNLKKRFERPVYPGDVGYEPKQHRKNALGLRVMGAKGSDSEGSDLYASSDSHEWGYGGIKSKGADKKAENENVCEGEREKRSNASYSNTDSGSGDSANSRFSDISKTSASHRSHKISLKSRGNGSGRNVSTTSVDKNAVDSNKDIRERRNVSKTVPKRAGSRMSLESVSSVGSLYVKIFYILTIIMDEAILFGLLLMRVKNAFPRS